MSSVKVSIGQHSVGSNCGDVNQVWEDVAWKVGILLVLLWNPVLSTQWPNRRRMGTTRSPPIPTAWLEKFQRIYGPRQINHSSESEASSGPWPYRQYQKTSRTLNYYFMFSWMPLWENPPPNHQEIIADTSTLTWLQLPGAQKIATDFINLVCKFSMINLFERPE